MSRTLAVQQSRVIPVSVDDAFAGTLPLALTTIFSRWYGPIPPVADVREQQGEWGTAGQTRVVAFKGVGAMHETLTSVDPPRSFGYAITGTFTRPRCLPRRCCPCWACCGGATRAGRSRCCRPS